MFFVCIGCPKSFPKRRFKLLNKNKHRILNPCVKFELNLLKIKKLRKDLICDGTCRLELEMTSYSDNVYDVTEFFVVLKSSWPMLCSYQVSLLSNAKWQSITRREVPPLIVIEVSWSRPKLG